jgi:ABC-type multidrug transport system ATPase subunit
MDKIVEAVKLADAWEFIEKLPHKYDEILAANAQNLSGGQKQRLAIARAILIEPKIIIFDESTSGLDSETEKYLQNTMQTLKKTATVILIAHRLSAIKNADKIFVLGDEGNIVEQGSFTELLQKKHYFYHLYESQSGGYPIFLEQLRLLIKSAQRYRRPFSMALLNLQNAKALNRQLGEQDFNTLIEKLEFFIKLKLREVDIGGYYKDGELAIVFTETPFAGAQLAMHRLNQELAGQFAGALQLGLALTEFADNDSIEIIFERLRSKKDVV